jgi:DNA gyrase subunit A
MTANGKLIRVRAQDIRAVGRATQGVRLINLDDDDKVTAATLIAAEGDKGLEEGQPAPESGPTVH